VIRARRAAPLLAGVALLLGVAVASGCGSTLPPGDQVPGRVLTIYASVPQHGISSADAMATLHGEQQALSQRSNRIGKYRVVLHPLDDSTPQRDGWDPGQTSANARLALADRTTIAYLGDFNSGASAISIPLLNRMRIAQISAASTATGLTSAGPGASPGEPQKYYPSGIRTFARVVPGDDVQASAQLALQQRSGCTKTYVLDDGAVDSEDGAESFAARAAGSRVQVVSVGSFDPLASDYSALAASVAASGADCLLLSAAGSAGAALLTRQLAAALPHARLFATAGVLEGTYLNAQTGGIPLVVQSRFALTAPLLPAARYGSPDRSEIYGYEAMSLLISAIERATDGGRRAARRSKVVAQVFKTRDRRSVLGTYSIDRNGDTTQRRYAAYRVAGGRLRFWMQVTS
jgi:branched-chain amino acid transport system substrate-binding protein